VAEQVDRTTDLGVDQLDQIGCEALDRVAIAGGGSNKYLRFET
jgi:hypothetical protein